MHDLPQGILVVGQSGGPTTVMNASLAAVIQAAQEQPQAITKIYGLVHGIEGALNEAFIDLTNISRDELKQLETTPGAVLGSTRYKLTDAEFERVLDVFQKYGVRYFVYIGGNGSMWVCNHLGELAEQRGYDLRVAGVPKTVDNDLVGTDFSPGYPSAARFMALVTRDAGRDLEAMATFDDVVILESMGRNTGWLAAASALLKQNKDEAPHLVYVPEIPFDEDSFIGDVSGVHQRLGYCFVVVAEGLRDENGNFIGLSDAHKDSLGRPILHLSNGVGAYLAGRVRERLGLQTRCLRPGLIGRSLSECTTRFDRLAAHTAGTYAVIDLMRGHNQIMVALRHEFSVENIHSIGQAVLPLSDIHSHEKRLSHEYMNDAGNMTTQAFSDYALPLIGEVPPLVRLNALQVAKR
ncbi:MAG: diphosphate--fructose-6-phosphate 1-phosphotransferase [Burkholderiales bacterium]|nr:diphosphate--fructose-6-phosphate 1-phosphotransferase [Anaerolineae bacterium]